MTQFQHKILMNHFGQIHLLLGHIEYCTGVRVECKQGWASDCWGERSVISGLEGSRWDTWHLSLAKLIQHRKPRQGNTPTYFNRSPKACWVSGKLKNWSVVKETHAESREQQASSKTDHKVSLLSWIKRKHKSLVTMGIKEFLIRAVIRVSRYTLHSPLWDAVTGWTCCNMKQKQGGKKAILEYV